MAELTKETTPRYAVELAVGRSGSLRARAWAAVVAAWGAVTGVSPQEKNDELLEAVRRFTRVRRGFGAERLRLPKGG